jgi:hypothetical protein
VLLVVLVAVVAACGGSAPSSGAAASGDGSPEVSGAPVATPDPAGSDDPGTSADPEATDEPEPSDKPAETDDPDATGSPTAEAGAGAAACSGSASNRTFFEDAARAVDWTVLCGVLPKGWFVAQGSYRLANGGRLVISYKGPGGASLTLSEGAYCMTDASACTPSGDDLGGAALGPFDGTLYETADGYAIVVNAGENPAWSMTTTGVTLETTVKLGAALATVEP